MKQFDYSHMDYILQAQMAAENIEHGKLSLLNSDPFTMCI